MLSGGYTAVYLKTESSFVFLYYLTLYLPFAFFNAAREKLFESKKPHNHCDYLLRDKKKCFEADVGRMLLIVYSVNSKLIQPSNTQMHWWWLIFEYFFFFLTEMCRYVCLTLVVFPVFFLFFFFLNCFLFLMFFAWKIAVIYFSLF